jgi:hypothetical protein
MRNLPEDPSKVALRGLRAGDYEENPERSVAPHPLYREAIRS